MDNTRKNLEILLPKNQTQLFGYENYFNSFIELYKKNNLPNTILLSGPKGIGKATFIYHFINYLLSINEQNKYSINNFAINSDNKSYKNLCNSTHPNLLVLENSDLDEDIKIENVRNILKFLNKSTYSSNIKIILIDNAEYLNEHSSNALLKVLEESNSKTYFFIIHNNNKKILSTIKSRCIEFKFFFNIAQKMKIIENIIKQKNYNFDIKRIDKDFFFDTPGNILKYLILLRDSDIDFSRDKLSCIFYLCDKYKSKSDSQLLTLISIPIELHYNELAKKNSKNLNLNSFNKYNLIQKIHDTKKFNLDRKNLFILLKGALKHESK